MLVKKGKAIGSGAKGTVYQAINEETGELVALKEITLVLPSRHSTATSEATVGDQDEEPQEEDHEHDEEAATLQESASQSHSAHDSETLPSPGRFYSPDVLAVDNIRNEIELLRQHAQEHPNLIRYLGCNIISEGVLNTVVVQLITEYVPGGSVSQRVRNHGPLSESVARSYVRDILVGLVYLHDVCHVCHRDIKGENVLITAEGQCKICDFGASKALTDSKHLLRTCVGTVFFMAPEVLQGEGYSYSADIWSLGCTLFEMLDGRPPFSELDNPMAIMYKVCVEEQAPTFTRDSSNAQHQQQAQDLSDDCLDFLAQCFQRDPRKRPTAKELLFEHPWMEQLAPSSSEGEGEEEDDEETANSFNDRFGFSGAKKKKSSGGKGNNKSPTRFSISRKRMSMSSKRRTSMHSLHGDDEDDAFFFPLANDEKKALKEYFASCQKCKDSVALFSCDACRRLEYAHQLCAKCWDTAHAHHRVASHRKCPLLVRNPAATATPPQGRSPGDSPSTSQSSAKNASKTTPTFKKPKSAHSVAFSSAVHQETLKGGSVVELYTVEPTEWVCGKCHYMNDAMANDCFMCDNQR